MQLLYVRLIQEHGCGESETFCLLITVFNVFRYAVSSLLALFFFSPPMYGMMRFPSISSQSLRSFLHGSAWVGSCNYFIWLIFHRAVREIKPALDERLALLRWNSVSSQTLSGIRSSKCLGLPPERPWNVWITMCCCWKQPVFLSLKYFLFNGTDLIMVISTMNAEVYAATFLYFVYIRNNQLLYSFRHGVVHFPAVTYFFVNSFLLILGCDYCKHLIPWVIFPAEINLCPTIPVHLRYQLLISFHSSSPHLPWTLPCGTYCNKHAASFSIYLS